MLIRPSISRRRQTAQKSKQQQRIQNELPHSQARGETRAQAEANTWRTTDRATYTKQSSHPIAVTVQPQGMANTKCLRGGKLIASNTEQTHEATHGARDHEIQHKTWCSHKHQEPPKVQHNALGLLMVRKQTNRARAQGATTSTKTMQGATQLHHRLKQHG
ncbi:hypothetical protein Taro_016123 [Colocasia esculenta]|uniref:Uncharacterized protein n=1 Tax=Colocasia esculenta TaxID=4460 RepID=A0A843UJG3_COLES|nr:hypothetical protein [Colocasia esculenta]